MPKHVDMVRSTWGQRRVRLTARELSNRHYFISSGKNSLQTDPWEGRKRGRTCKFMGIENTLDIVRMGTMANIHINWYLVKKKVVNLSHNMRYLMKWGEGQQIIVTKAGSTRSVKEHFRR